MAQIATKTNLNPNDFEQLTNRKPSLEKIDNAYEKLIKDQFIQFSFNQADLRNLPKESAFILLANHPLEGIDSLLLLKVISQIRPDIKVLHDIELPRYSKAINEYYIGKSAYYFKKINAIDKLKAKEHLSEGKPLIVFPAGATRGIQFKSPFPFDARWSKDTLRFIRDLHIPVLPVYLNVKQSFKLPGISFLANNNDLNMEIERSDYRIILRIGSVIPVNEQMQFNSIDSYSKYLRARIFSLGSPLEVNKFFQSQKKAPVEQDEIVPAVDHEILNLEVQYLKSKYLLFESQHYSVICAPTKQMPNLITEIGRLREITFREVGEGTNRSIDIDEFDIYYHQLFIWDNNQNKLVGAYRVGKGNEIIEQYGLKGFYIRTLFKTNEKAIPLLSQSLELGRSFIVSEYQRQPLSLFLLWKGILYFLFKNPEYRYLIGPVSISNQYTVFSKNMIVQFMTENHFDHTLAAYFKPRKGLKPKISKQMKTLLDNTQNNLNRLDDIIGDVELNHYKMPVLLKKYLKLNARLLAFNVDPLFNNCLDGLILLDLNEVPQQFIQSLSKEINDETILSRLNKN